MEESVTYQAIIAKGQQQGALMEARKTVMLLGRELFGPPDKQVRAAVEALDDVERLEQLTVRLLRIDSWQDLLELPPRQGRQRKSRS